ncbi:MAG: hypothetical protein ASARMPREDX12_007620 [Alectoria sarmentosa]|nr:MAG: hypothetical protein ASARMPREDX12_007620 [Alectoria sarmentosa]
MFDRINGDLTVFIHEAGHSLDLPGAYPDKPLSNSTRWLAQYAYDSHVPDPYSQTNQREEVAQNTVVAAYDLNVRGGFGVVEPGWDKVFHQFDTIKLEQMKAGSLLVRGGLCGKRLQNSEAVKVEGSSRIRARGQGGRPDVGLSDGVDVIDSVVFDTREDCKHGY